MEFEKGFRNGMTLSVGWLEDFKRDVIPLSNGVDIVTSIDGRTVHLFGFDINIEESLYEFCVLNYSIAYFRL